MERKTFTFIKTLKSLTVITVVLILALGVSQQVKGQTIAPPLFTENFGAVPSGQDTNAYRTSITGRGTIGNDFWYWPAVCTDSSYVSLATPVLQTSFALTLPADAPGVTEWSFVPVGSHTGAPYTTAYLDKPANTWCWNGSSWTGPNTNCPTGDTTVRWYQVCGTWELGYYQRFQLSQLLPCAQWHNSMDDGGYCLSHNPYYAHGEASWHTGPDHTGDLGGMMLVVNAALQPGMFYERDITGLCDGTQFDFRSYYENLDLPNACGPGNPIIPTNIRYEVWSGKPDASESNAKVQVGGQACNGAVLLASTSTGNIGDTSIVVWHQTDLIFTIPQNQDSVVIILRNNSPGGCGNDLAIDDITFSPYTPFTLAYNAITTSYCSTGQITLQGSISSGTIPPAVGYIFQWQVANQATPNSWTSLGSPFNNILNASLVLDAGSVGNKLYRLVSATNAQNFNNSNCYVASANFTGNSIVIPTGSVTALTADVCGTNQATPENATFTVHYQGNVYPWTYFYQVNGGPILSQSVSAVDSSNVTIKIAANTIVTLDSISTSICGVGIHSQVSIGYSTTKPGTPILINGPNPACIGTTAAFSVPPVTEASSYNWVVQGGGWQLLSGQGTDSVELLIGTAPITVMITTENACGTNFFNSDTFQTTNSPPPAPVTISTPNGICLSPDSIGTTNILFQSSTVAGAQNYIWSYSTPIALGTQQSGTGQFLQSIYFAVPNDITGYTIGVQTQNGCGYSAITQTRFIPNKPAAPAVTLIQTNCTVATGTITVTRLAGTTLTYSIDGINYKSDTTFTGLAANTYNVTARNTLGCISPSTVAVINAQPATPAAPTVSTTQPGCSVSTGAIAVTAPTGAGLTYSIDSINYQVSANFGNLSTGNYNITAKNTSGCISAATEAYINTQPATPAAPTLNIAQPTCTVAVGSITVTDPLGIGLTYSIDGVNYQSDPIFNDLVPGRYTITVENTAGCISQATGGLIKSQPVTPSAPSVVLTQPNCSIGTGTITITPSLGLGFTYSIDGINYQKDTVFSGLSANNYNVTIQSAYGCISSASIAVINPELETPAQPTLSITQPSCLVATGTITVTAPLGAGLTYSIDGVSYQASNIFNGLAANTYNVTVQYGTECLSAATAAMINSTLTAPQAPSVTITQPNCTGTSGTITVTAPLGDGLTYSIDGATYQASPIFNNVTPNTYNVTVQYGAACTSAASIANVISSGQFSMTISPSQALCTGDSAILVASGAGDGGTYTWSTGANTATITVGPSVKTTYNVTVTSAGNCSATDSATVYINTNKLITSNDTSICRGASVVLSASAPGALYLWTPSGSLNDSTSANPIATPTVTTTYTVQTLLPSVPDNLIFNGDFSSGNTGFSSSYTFISAAENAASFDGDEGLVPEGYYSVDSNAHNYHPEFYGDDHDSPHGNFMIVNGAPDSGVVIWQQTVNNVMPNTTYYFSTYISALNNISNFAKLSFSINGNDIGYPIDAPADSLVWTKFFAQWVSGSSDTSAVIAIVNQDVIRSGNDFGLDDITFTIGICPLSKQVTVTVDTLPSTTISPVTTVCPGSTQQYSYSGFASADSSVWSVTGDGAITGSITGASVNVQSTGSCNSSYTVSLTSYKGACSNSSSQNISVIDTTPPVAICKNATVTLVNGLASITGADVDGGSNDACGDIRTTVSPSTFNCSNIGLNAVTLTVQDACGNTSTCGATVLILAPPSTISIVPNEALCAGDYAVLSASGAGDGGTYTWSTGANTPSITVNPSVNTTYTVTITSAGNCSATDSVTVYINTNSLTVSGDTTIYLGGSAALSASAPGALYIWSPGGSLNDSTSATPIATPTVTTTYTVQTLLPSVPDNLIYNGDFSIGNTGFTSGYTFISAEDNATSFDGDEGLVPEGYYSVDTNAHNYHPEFYGDDHDSPHGNFMIVNGAPDSGVVIWQQTVRNVLPNTTYYFSTYISALNNISNFAKLSFSINGNDIGFPIDAPVDSLVWKKFFAQWVSGANDTSAVIAIVNQDVIRSGNDFGLDDISFTIGLCPLSKQVTVTVDTLPVTTTPPPPVCVGSAGPNQALCAGDFAVLIASGAGDGGSYNWSTGATTPNITVDPSVNTTYYVTVTSGNCSVTDSVSVYVNTNSVAVSGDTTIYLGGSALLSANAPGALYLWTPGGSLNDSTSANPIATPTVTTTYTVQTLLPSVPDNLIYNGDFSIGNTGFTSGYTFISAEDNATSFDGDEGLVPEGYYSVDTNAHTYHPEFYGDDHDSPHGNFMIVNGAPDSGVVIWQQTVNGVLPNTTYYFSTYISSLNNFANSARLSFSINGNNIGFPIDAPADSLVWKKFFAQWISGANDTSAVIAIVNQDVVRNGNDFGLDDISFTIGLCPLSRQVTVTVDTLPNTHITPPVCPGSVSPNQAVCAGDAASIRAFGADDGGTYLWSTGESASAIVVDPLVTTTYYVTITSTPTCIVIDSVTVYVNTNSLTVTGDTTIYLGGSAALSANAPGALYLWTPGGSLNDSTSANPIATPTVTTTYTVQTLLPSSPDNLIYNGDFSLGNAGFTSGYTFISAAENEASFDGDEGLVPEGYYSVDTNAHTYHYEFYGQDHDNPHGNFMIVNGAPDSGVVIWQQTVRSVLPNTTYYFSTWISSLNNYANSARLSFSINGKDIGYPIDAPADSLVWKKFFAQWISGPNDTSAVIAIVNQDVVRQGNDFGLDDISFTLGICPLSQQVTVTVDQKSLKAKEPAISKLSAYPNPTKSEVTFDLVFGADMDNVSLTITDLTGQIVGRVYEGSVIGNQEYHTKFDASILASGMYYYQLHSPQGNKNGNIVVVK